MCILGCLCAVVFFFFKQKTAYEMRISDWSSDVCSSDLCDLSDQLIALAALTIALERALAVNADRCRLAIEGELVAQQNGRTDIDRIILGDRKSTRLNSSP